MALPAFAAAHGRFAGYAAIDRYLLVTDATAANPHQWLDETDRQTDGRTPDSFLDAAPRAALTGKHDTLVRRAPGWPSGAPCQPGALRIHLTHLSTEGLGPRHGEVRRAHQMLNAALNSCFNVVHNLNVLQFNHKTYQ